MPYRVNVKKYGREVPPVLGTELRPKREPLRIGLDMPDWIPDGAVNTAKTILGGAIGVAMGIYCLAAAVIVSRILDELMMGGGSPQLSVDVGNLAALILSSVAFHHALARRQERNRTDL